MDDCVFCRIIRKEVPADIIYEDENVLTMLDIDYSIKGHTLVIWKKHYINISDLPENDFIYFSRILHKTEKTLLKTLKKDRSLILKSGIIVPHFHFHIYPVSYNITWPEIKDIFSKKTKYQYKRGEKEKLIKLLQEY